MKNKTRIYAEQRIEKRTKIMQIKTFKFFVLNFIEINNT